MNRSRQAGSSAGGHGGPPIDAVVSHHLDGFRSGVARFNELLAERLGVPLLGLFDQRSFRASCPLLSFKVSELSASERQRVGDALDLAPWAGELFLHEACGDRLEERLIRQARRVHCGNLQILEAVQGQTSCACAAWTPGLIQDDRLFRPAEITVFSFGMAHKIQADRFRRLRELLDASGRSYTIYVSAANHETASIRDAELVFHEMHDIFPNELYFLGNLSDVAVANELRRATFFAAFFPGGVRGNNTSVASALERGCIVITNLDEYSPPEFVHMENVIDLDRCGQLPTDPLVCARLKVHAIETGRARGWDRLVAAVGLVGDESAAR